MTDVTLLQQRLNQMIQVGVIEEVQAKPLRYRVRFDEQRVSGWCYCSVAHAKLTVTWSPYQVGEQVLVFFPGGVEPGVVQGAIYQTSVDQPNENLKVFYQIMPDGTEIEYNSDIHHLSVKQIEGSAHIKAPQHVTIETDLCTFTGDVQIDGELHVDGNIKGEKDITDKRRSMELDRGIYDSHQHPETSVNTQPPLQKQGG